MIVGGAICERWSIFTAGFASAEDPKYTVGPQRAPDRAVVPRPRDVCHDRDRSFGRMGRQIVGIGGRALPGKPAPDRGARRAPATSAPERDRKPLRRAQFAGVPR